MRLGFTIKVYAIKLGTLVVAGALCISVAIV